MSQHLPPSGYDRKGKQPGSRHVPFARCNDDVIRHIDEIEDKSCGPFYCPGCGEQIRLKAAKSVLVVKHLSHTPNTVCNGETALHQYAKRILCEEKYVMFPELSINHSGNNYVMERKYKATFDEVIPEWKVGSRIVDIFGKSENLSCYIEFAVYHKSDENKVNDLSELGYSAFEIDLGPPELVPSTISDLNTYILEGAKRYWLYHTKYVDYYNDLEASAKSKQASINEYKCYAQGVLVEFGKGNQFKKAITKVGDQAISDVKLAGLIDCIGLRIDGDYWFSVSNLEWQARILQNYIESGVFDSRSNESHVIIGRAWAEDKSKSYNSLPHWTLCDRLLSAIPDEIDHKKIFYDLSNNPSDVVDAYVMKLLQLIKAKEGIQGYVYGNMSLVRERVRRVKKKVLNLLRVVGLSKDRYDIWHRWKRTPFENGKTPYQIILSSVEGAEKIIENLDRYGSMNAYEFRKNENLKFMGLPLHRLKVLAPTHYEPLYTPVSSQMFPASTGYESAPRVKRRNKESPFMVEFLTAMNAKQCLQTKGCDEANSPRDLALSTTKSKDSAIAELRALALKALGTEQAAEDWLSYRFVSLQGFTPRDCVTRKNLNIIASLLLGWDPLNDPDIH